MLSHVSTQFLMAKNHPELKPRRNHINHCKSGCSLPPRPSQPLNLEAASMPPWVPTPSSRCPAIPTWPQRPGAWKGWNPTQRHGRPWMRQQHRKNGGALRSRTWWGGIFFWGNTYIYIYTYYIYIYYIYIHIYIYTHYIYTYIHSKHQ